MTETDKITARLHLFEPDLIAGLFAQDVAKGQPVTIKPIFQSRSVGGHHLPSPMAGIDITTGDSLTIEAWVKPVPVHSNARPVLVCGETNGTGSLIHFFAPGGRGRALALLFRGTHDDGRANASAIASEQIAQLGVNQPHQVAVVVDGLAQIASMFVDGVLLDGSTQLGTGFIELAELLTQKHNGTRNDATAEECSVGSDVLSIRVYGSRAGSSERGYMRTSEIVSSFRAGPAQHVLAQDVLKSDDDTFYVSPSGSDEASGLSRDDPVKTLRHVQALVKSHLHAVAFTHVQRADARNVTVILMNGSFYNTSLSFTAADGAGAGTERVTWKADGASSTIFGGARVEGFVYWRSGIWRAPLPVGLANSKGRATFQTLVEGERSCWQARHPDYGSGWLSVNASTFSGEGFGWGKEAGLPDAFDCIASACSVYARAMYSSDIRPVLSVDLAKRQLTMVGGPTTDKLRGAGGPSYSSPSVYVSGAVEFISSPGEWAVRDNQLYYMPYQSVDPNSLVITAPATKRVLSFVGNTRQNPVKGISIVGLRLIGSDMPALFLWSCMSGGIMDGPGSADPPCSTATGQPNTVPRSSSHGLVYTENASDITIKNCTIRASGPAAIWLQEASSNMIVRENVIQDIAGHGVYANGIAPNDTRFSSAADSDVNYGHQIYDNLIVSGGLRTTHGSGIFLFQSGRSVITHNKIAQFPRDCVAYYGNCCNAWNAQQVGSGSNGATPRYLDGSKYWGKYLTISGRQNGTLSTTDVLHCRSSYLAYNDLGQCNREGIDGGTIESSGNGGNNTWEFNAIHDHEGPGNLFFADDLSSGLTIRSNLVYENVNVLAFMMKSLNMTVERNILADNRLADIFYLSVYHLPASNMSITENLIWNCTEGGVTVCNASTNFSHSLACASYYSAEACNPNSGLGFSTATLGDELAFGNSGSCHDKVPGLPNLGDGHCIPWSDALFGFSEQQLATPIVRIADYNYVDDRSRLHVGSTAQWDKHTTVLTSTPFKPVDTAWHSKTALDYQLDPTSAAAKTGLGIDVTRIGQIANRVTYPLRHGFEKIQAEQYERTRGLWTTIATGLGSGANMITYLPPFRPGPGQVMSYHALPIAVDVGSWARYDGVDFGDHQDMAVSVIAMVRHVGCPVGEAFPAPSSGPCELHPPTCLLGASVRLQLEGPEQRKKGRTLASFEILAHPNNSGFGLVSGRVGDALPPRTPASVFMVFMPLAANCSSGKAGGVVDWFCFVATGQPISALKSDDLTIEDSFARHRGKLIATTSACVPGISGVTAEFAVLTNKTLVVVGGRVHQQGCEASSTMPVWWTVAALAPAMTDDLMGGGSVLWETEGALGNGGAVWALSESGPSPPKTPAVMLAKPIGSPSTITYLYDLPTRFTGTYWREEVLKSQEDILANHLLSDGQSISYDTIARVLPRLTGQMGDKIEAQRHRGGPSFVSDPDSERWWQLRQNGALLTGGTPPSGQALSTIGAPFHPGWTRPDLACSWPNHDGPAPLHGPQCMHVAGLLNGWLPVINTGLRDTSSGATYEQVVLASADSVFLANRTGNARAGWHLWQFYKSELRDNSTERLIPTSASEFISALVSTNAKAKDFIGTTALSEARLEVSAEPLLADAARASMLLGRATYVGDSPRYGIGPQYWKQVNDAFPPATLATALTLGSIGAPSAAADRLGFFLDNLVDSTGHVLYYGTAMSELGQLLQAASTVVIDLDALEQDAGNFWLERHAAKLGAIAEKLLVAQRNATQNRGSSHGLLWGCPEADLCSTPDGQGLFLTSGLWAWRGLNDLAAVASPLTSLGITSVAAMRDAAAQLLSDTRAAIAHTQHSTGWVPPCLNCSAAATPFNTLTESRIASYTNYRFYPEMMSSGGLSTDVATKLGEFRRSHGGELLGMTRFETWLDDWPIQAMALWWLELEETTGNSSMGSADHYAMTMLSHIAHHSSRGTYTAYEQANWADNQADNCVPSQLAAPTLLLHSLVHANAVGDKLWFHRGVPDHWFMSSQEHRNAGFRIIDVSVRLAGPSLVSASTNVTMHTNGATTCTLTVVRHDSDTIRSSSRSAGTNCLVRLLPADGQTSYVQVNGRPWTDIDRKHGIIRNVPCVPTEPTTMTTVIEVLRPPAPPKPPHNFPPQPTVPPHCNCSAVHECAFISQPTQGRSVFAYLDDGGPQDDRDNWETALNWSVTTHVIRNTHHPLLISENGKLVLNDPLWPTTGSDSMLCTAHSKGVRVLADVDPLGFDAHHIDPAKEEANFLRNSSAVSCAALQIAAYIIAAGYDGAAFDFEGLSVGSWSLGFEHEVGDGLIQLVMETRAALRAKNPSAEVAFAVSTNSNPWFNQSYRMGAITAQLDYTILMGYDIWHCNTDAGPNSPLPAVKAALHSFLNGWQIPAAKLVLGIGWYGYTYRCQDPIPSPLPSNPIFTPGLPSRPNCSAGVAPFAPCCSPWAPFSSSTARSFEAMLANHSGNCSARVRDLNSGSAVFECFREGLRLQSWFDDDWATGTKALLADQLNLGGLAIWTAGNAPYGPMGARYWQALADPRPTALAQKSDDNAAPTLEELRPIFHYTECAGEMNDPNGLQWRRTVSGPEYHLFF